MTGKQKKKDRKQLLAVAKNLPASWDCVGCKGRSELGRGTVSSCLPSYCAPRLILIHLLKFLLKKTINSSIKQCSESKFQILKCNYITWLRKARGTQNVVLNVSAVGNQSKDLKLILISEPQVLSYGNFYVHKVYTFAHLYYFSCTKPGTPKLVEARYVS